MMFYRIIVWFLLPWALIKLWWRSRKHPAYAHRWAERLGYSAPVPPGTLWIHAVSVGEVRAALPLIRSLLSEHRNTPLLITTTTLTGAAQVEALFGTTVVHRFAPFDLPIAVRRFLQHIQPRAVVILETELWPVLFQELHRAHIPLLLANVRLSERSYLGYRRFPRLIRATLRIPAVIAAQSTADRNRLAALGAPEDRLFITGNMKFELAPTTGLREAAQALRQQWGTTRLVWVAASTHQGEEEAVLHAHTLLRAIFPTLLLILVPRHPERFETVGRLCQQHGFSLAQRSQNAAVAPTTSVLLGDTMGELMLFFASADCAFIGGSLVPTGGHNPLEALALGIPVVLGPHMFNFQLITQLTLEAGAGQQINSPSALAKALEHYLGNLNARAAAGAAGERLIRHNQGACQRTLALLLPLLKTSMP